MRSPQHELLREQRIVENCKVTSYVGPAAEHTSRLDEDVCCERSADSRLHLISTNLLNESWSTVRRVSGAG